MILTLEEMKLHLRLPLDVDSELDAQLNDMEDAAVDYASQFLNRSIPWQDSEGSEVPVPASIRQALLLIVGDFFENREAQNTQSQYHQNPAAERLMHFYRVELGI